MGGYERRRRLVWVTGLLPLSCTRLASPRPEPPDPAIHVPPDRPVEPTPLGSERLDARDVVYISTENGPFPTMLDHGGVRLVLAVLAEPPLHLTLEDGALVHVTDEQLAQLELRRPDQLWMIGAAAPCRATLGSAYVGYYAEGLETWEVGVQLQPCMQDFAPIGVTAPNIAASLRWADAEVVLYETVPEGGLEHPIMPLALALGLGQGGDDSPAPEQQVRLLHVPGTELHQLYAIDYWPADEACDEVEAIDFATGLWDGTSTTMRSVEPAERPRWGPRGSELVGAVHVRGQPIAIVTTEAFQLGLGLLDDTGAYAWSSIETGSYHDEDVAFSHFSVVDYCGP